jgi:hypothetical protein
VVPSVAVLPASAGEVRDVVRVWHELQVPWVARGLRLSARQQSGRDAQRDAYLNEFTFRFNRRRSRRRGLLFYRLLQQAILTDPITYRSLIVNPRPTGRRPQLPSGPRPPGRPSAVHRPWRHAQQPEPSR